MPAELPIEQSLVLKKRARRRLVGAIALVLLMLIILPIILQDRVALNTADSVKITMNESEVGLPNADTFELTPTPDDIVAPIEPVVPNTADSSADANGAAQKNPEISKSVVENDAINLKIAELEKKGDVAIQKPTANSQAATLAEPSAKSAVLPKPVVKETDAAKKTEPVQNAAGFTIQIGVYSDAANVAQLQTKLTQAGFTSNTETISTDKGNKIRLRAGSYPTREAANTALTKLQAAGLSGLVMSKAK